MAQAASTSISASELRELDKWDALESSILPGVDPKSVDKRTALLIPHLVKKRCDTNRDMWDPFEKCLSREAFIELIRQIAPMPTSNASALDDKELASFCDFFALAFQCLERDYVRSAFLPFLSLPIWAHLSPGRLALELHKHAHLDKHWRSLKRRDRKKMEKAGGDSHVPFDRRIEATWLPGLIDECIRRMCREGNSQCTEAFITMCIDMQAQLPTRRFTKALLEDKGIMPALTLSGACDGNTTANQLMQLLQHYMHIGVDEHTGEQLSENDVESRLYSRLARMQMLVFVHHPRLKEVSLSPCRHLLKRKAIKSELSPASDHELKRLICNELCMISPESPFLGEVGGEGQRHCLRSALLEAFLSSFAASPSHRTIANTLSTYPGEDELRQAEDTEDKKSSRVTLPKLGLQFLSVPDHLLRSFYLYRLEVAHELAQEVDDVLARIGAKMNGWARYGATLTKQLRITSVTRPKIAESCPASVTAEVAIDTSWMTETIAQEWDSLRPRDVLLLLQGEEGADREEESGLGTLKSVRGAQIKDIKDGFDSSLIFDKEPRRRRPAQRKFIINLDPAQYEEDMKKHNSNEKVYSSLNVLMRREARANNFKALLETSRSLLNNEKVRVATWLNDVFLGYGDPREVSWRAMARGGTHLSLTDTFQDRVHMLECMRGIFADNFNEHRQGQQGSASTVTTDGESATVQFGEDEVTTQEVRFMPKQVEAIMSGLNEGLTLIVGPPGTGKTDVAAQLVQCLRHCKKEERILLVSHSNTALNDLFRKLAGKNVDMRRIVRLGRGEAEMSSESEDSFSCDGRIDAMLEWREDLLEKAGRLAESIGISREHAGSCVAASSMWLMHVSPRWEGFKRDVELAGEDADVDSTFPFKSFFDGTGKDRPHKVVGTVTRGEDRAMRKGQEGMREARLLFGEIEEIFTGLEECRMLEIMARQASRREMYLSNTARVIAMTATHAAINMETYRQMGITFSTIIVEEAAQMLEVEAALPLLLNDTSTDTKAEDSDSSNLKRLVLLGDHRQLPPIVKSEALKQQCNLDQTLFARLVRLGAASVDLNMQGRCRTEIADLFRGFYESLGDLERVNQGEYTIANAGLAHTCQAVDVGDYKGNGETSPSPGMHQNLGEAEYICALYQYMRLLGHEASSIAVLTTYRAQKMLLLDVFSYKCKGEGRFLMPGAIETVDRFQGRQAEIVLLSLVRTKAIGHLRDRRRLIVALSRAQKGLYIFARLALLQSLLPDELTNNEQRPTKLELVSGERHPTERRSDAVKARDTLSVDDVEQMMHISRLASERASANE